MYESKIKDELKRVKDLTSSKNSLWITDDRPAGDTTLFEEDSLLKIPKLGDVTLKILTDLGITKVGDLKHLPPDNITDLKELKIRSLQQILSAANDSALGSSPYTTTDHRKEPNPYLSKYGDEWRTVISKTVGLSPFVCVTSLVTYIIEESTRIMKGTVHEHDWYFYHDALSLMTAKTTLTWMEDMDYKKRWLLPMNGLNFGTRHHEKSAGNSPEFMPLDNSLFADLKRGHDRHVAVTMHLPKHDIRKFCNRTPHTISRGIKKLVESPELGIPSSK